MIELENQVLDLLEESRTHLSDISPSEWCEKYRTLTSDQSPVPGPFSYDYTPYTREIVDLVSPNSPMKSCTVMKGNQGGFSTGVIEAAIGYIIAEKPGNILFLTAHSDLAEEAVTGKIDPMIDSCGLRPLIRPSSLRKKNQRTGDTNKKKEFPGGSLTVGSADNHKLLRQRSVQYGFFDDYDSVRKSSKKSGSTTKLIEKRFTAYFHKMKLFFISTPETKEDSNIEPLYLKGDQRRFHIPCPCCGEAIPLYWETTLDGSEGKEKAGITWKLNEKGKLIHDSVGYICQKCGGFFDESRKMELLQAGFWVAMNPDAPVGVYSYHLSNLYSPPGMADWPSYVEEYLEANPPGGERDEELHQTFVNLVLGETYSPQGKTPKANDLQANVRNYEVGTIPEKLSINHGNGKIVLLTAAADLNGTENDARVDWEVVAWSEGGASYSVSHGSIGTFIPMENTKKKKEDRAHWTYELNRPRSVWPELAKVFNDIYEVDTNRKMRIIIAGVDCGHYSQHAYGFLDKLASSLRVGLKGRDESKMTKLDADVPYFKPAKERANLYLLEVNSIKDDLADFMRLRWDEGNDEQQPPGFMNYPLPGHGLYGYVNYFSHFEAEHKIIEKKEGKPVGWRWVKKNSAAQNHFWDVRVYNMGLKDLFMHTMCKAAKIPKPTWADYCDIALNRIKK